MNIFFEDPGTMSKKFGEQYQNHAQADSYLLSLTLNISKLRFQVDKYESERKKDSSETSKKVQELAEVNDSIYLIENSLNDLKTETMVLKFKQDLMENMEKREKLEDWMEKNNPNQENDNFIKYQNNRASLQYHIAIAEELCNWFATGAAGPGTLTFDGKTYTVN